MVSTTAAEMDDGTVDFLNFVSDHVDSYRSVLRTLSLDIHDHPETRFKEFHAHEVLTNFLAGQTGWTVTPSAYGLATAFVAVYDSGRTGPTVSFNAEYDALEGIGHACGHNLIAVASLAAALATGAVVREHGLPGKVVLFGTPAEEGGGGKIKLLRAGAYADHNVDISLISHPGVTADCALLQTAAYQSVKIEYFGKEAHAAARPWEGVNALDALVTAYNAVSVLRQQTQPADVIQCQIINGGARPNVIHAYAAGRFVIRCPSRQRLNVLKKRVYACFEGAATATGASMKISEGGSYDDHSSNRVLGRSYRNYFNRLGGEIPLADLDILKNVVSASTDQGNVSYAMPSLSPNFWIRSMDANGEQLGGPHTPDFAKAARTEEAHDKAMRVGKSLSCVALDMLHQPQLLQEAKNEFEEMRKHYDINV